MASVKRCFRTERPIGPDGKKVPKVKLSRFKDSKDRSIRWGTALANLGAGAIVPTFAYYFLQVAYLALRMKDFSFYVRILVALTIGEFICAGLGAFLPEWSAERQLLKLKRSFFQAILSQPMSYFDARDATVLGLQLSSYAEIIRELIGYKSGLYVLYLGIAMSSVVVAVIASPTIGSLSMLAVPIILIASWFLTESEVRANERIDRQTEVASETAQEVLGAIKTVKAFGLEEEMEKRFAKSCDDVYKVSAKSTLIFAFFQGLTWMLMLSSAGLALWVYARGAIKKRKGNLGFVGNFEEIRVSLCALLALLASYFVSKVIPLRAQKKRAMAAMRGVVAVLDQPRPQDPFNTEGATSQVKSGEVIFHNVAFAYPSTHEKKIFTNLSFTIKAGESVALVGGSGCGKSTIVQLIERFYDPESGSILFDGLSILAWNLQELRRRIAIVQQEPRLFATSVKDNIRVGKPDATDEEIIAAAKQSNIHDLIQSLPDGYDTFVGEGGGQLSGGQKQRIAIARAIIKNPVLLILDEATSALDLKSEKVVQETLEKIVNEGREKAGRQGSKHPMSVLTIAHRLSTIRRADRIVVLDNSGGEGSVVAEEGTHAELVARPGGLYRALVATQMGEVDDEAPSASTNTKNAKKDAKISKVAQSPKQTAVKDALAADTEPQDAHADAAESTPIGEALKDGKSKSSGELIRKESYLIAAEFKGDLSPRQNSLVALHTQYSQPEEEVLRRMPTDVLDLERRPKKRFWQKRYFRRLLAPSLYKPLSILSTVVGAVALGLTWPLFAEYFASTMEIYVEYDSTWIRIRRLFRKHIWKPFAVGAVAFMGQWLATWCSNQLAMNAIRNVRKNAFKNVLKQDGAFFDVYSHGSGQLTHLIVAETSTYRRFCGENFVVVISCIATIAGACYLNKRLSTAVFKRGLVIFALTIPLAYLSVVAFALANRRDDVESFGTLKKISRAAFSRCGRKDKNERDTTRPRKDELNPKKDPTIDLHPQRNSPENVSQGNLQEFSGMNTTASLVTESVLNIRNVASFTMQQALFEKYEAISHRAYKRGVAVSVVAGVMNGASYSLRLGLFCWFLNFISAQVASEEISGNAIKDVMASLVGTALAIFALGRPVLEALNVTHVRRAASNTFTLTDRKTKIDDRSMDGEPIAQLQDGQFQHVNFRYPVRPDTVVYRDVSFNLPQGKVVALVGASGCGKSTAVQLLLRFYQLEKTGRVGRILINNKPIEQYAIPSLRSITGLVSQEPALFWNTIEENVAMGNRGASTDDILEALEKANAKDFVSTLDGGIQYNVGRGGAKLSGGQKQRIAIARALVRKPQLMILDEATSALDAHSEKVVQATLDELIASRTFSLSVIIAHRLSSVRNADQIVVFSNPKNEGSHVAEVGTHEELVRIPDGIYAGLIRIAQSG